MNPLPFKVLGGQTSTIADRKIQTTNLRTRLAFLSFLVEVGKLTGMPYGPVSDKTFSQHLLIHPRTHMYNNGVGVTIPSYMNRVCRPRPDYEENEKRIYAYLYEMGSQSDISDTHGIMISPMRVRLGVFDERRTQLFSNCGAVGFPTVGAVKRLLALFNIEWITTRPLDALANMDEIASLFQHLSLIHI